MDATDLTLPTVTEDVMEMANIIVSMSTEQGVLETPTEHEEMEISIEKGDMELTPEYEDMETSMEQEDAEQESTEQPEECLGCHVEFWENDHMVRVVGCQCTFCWKCLKWKFDVAGVHTCPVCGEDMGAIQLGRWHEEKGFVSDEEKHATETEQEEEENKKKLADLPLYDETLAESLAASQESLISGDFAIPPNSIAPPNFTGMVILGDTYASEAPRVTPLKPTPRKSVKQMRQEIQALHGNKPFSVEDESLAKRLRLSS